MISRASRSVASGIFILGLMMVGFGFVIYVFPEFFATLAAIVFFLAGLSCAITAIKIFWVTHKIGKTPYDESERYRKNVQIHTEEYYDV